MTNEENRRQEKAIDNIRQRLISRPVLMECVRILFSDVIIRDWWRRVWIIQEAALARSLLVKCGKDELDWEHFLGVFFDIHLACSSIDNLMAVEERNKRALDFERLTNIQFLRSMTSRNASLPLSDLVAFNRASRATESKDMVYSLLGLARGGTSPMVAPKYSRSISHKEVYIDFVKQSISENLSLDIITMSRRRFSTTGLPTWVPDWNALSQSFNASTPGIDANLLEEDPLIFRYGNSLRMQEYIRHQTMWDGTQSWRSLWRASKDLPANVIISHLPTVTLTSKGVRVDSISNVSTGKAKPMEWEKMVLERFGNATTQWGDQPGDRSILSVFDCCLRVELGFVKDGFDEIRGPMKWIAH